MAENNVVKFMRPQDMEEDQKAEFFDDLQKDCESMVFIKRVDEDNYVLGHTPIDTKELIYIFYYLQMYVQRLIHE